MTSSSGTISSEIIRNLCPNEKAVSTGQVVQTDKLLMGDKNQCQDWYCKKIHVGHCYIVQPRAFEHHPNFSSLISICLDYKLKVQLDIDGHDKIISIANTLMNDWLDEKTLNEIVIILGNANPTAESTYQKAKALFAGNHTKCVCAIMMLIAISNDYTKTWDERNIDRVLRLFNYSTK